MTPRRHDNTAYRWFASELFASLLMGMVLFQPRTLLAQSLIEGSASTPVRLFPTDQAILETQEPRKDLPCTVNPTKPVLGFDLRFHAGYDVTIPMRELAGSGDKLTIIFRVTPHGPEPKPVYFSDRVQVPAIEEEAKGEAYVHGAFDIGEGSYHVDWLMRDRNERICSSYWDVEAALSSRDKDLQLALGEGKVRASESELFQEEPPHQKSSAELGLDLKLLVNLVPLNSRSTVLQPVDTNALVSALRAVAREPSIRRLSLVVFNLQEFMVMHRQDDVARIDFPALGNALRVLNANAGTVDVKRLSQKHPDTEFLTDLIQKELRDGKHPDAVVFLGPKVMLEQNVSREALQQLGDLNYPLFYLNYNLVPQANPWTDAISSAVKFFKGYEYSISRPRDLWFAVSEMVSRITSFKRVHQFEGSLSK